MRLYLVEIEHREAATGFRFPIIRHQFFGRDRAEALRYHESHRQSDRFLRECEDHGVFADHVKCTAQPTEVGWVDVDV